MAQDLGDSSLTAAYSDNWPHVWDRVIGWSNSTHTLSDAPPSTELHEKQEMRWKNIDGGIVDFGPWMLKGMDYAAKGAAYISLAIIFFVLYWLAAGPGSYLLLANKKRKELNWFVYGAWAFAGTAVTIVIVRLVLHGQAEARHLSIIRSVPGEPTYVFSRVGMYIPRDGDQTIALGDTAHDAISYITPLQIHPEYVDAGVFPAAQEYTIPIHNDPQPVSVRVPFRSTLKKLQVRWVGETPAGIAGSARLVGSTKGLIAGNLVNGTGVNLKNVYFAFSYVDKGMYRSDKVLFMPSWTDQKAIDLAALWDKAKIIVDPDIGVGEGKTYGDPRDGANVSSIRGVIDGQWNKYWTHKWEGDNRGAADYDDPSGVPKAFPILSLFDRIPPMPNVMNSYSRIDFSRSGGRELNMSAAVGAGNW